MAQYLHNEIKDSSGIKNVEFTPNGPVFFGSIGQNFQVGIASPSASPFNMTTTDGLGVVLLNFASGTVNLPPTASSSGRRIIFKKIHATRGLIALTPNTGTIDNASTLSLLNRNDAVTLYCDGTNWFVLSRSILNLIQRKSYTGSGFSFSTHVDLNGGSNPDLSFNNLIIGRRYRYTINLNQIDNAANPGYEINLYSATGGGGTKYSFGGSNFYFGITIGSAIHYTGLSYTFEFEAVSTIAVARLAAFSGTKTLATGAFAWITEMNDTLTTTEFT